MISQYVTSSTLPTYITEYLSSHIGYFDKYIGFYTGDNSIDFIVEPAFGDPYVLHFARSGNYGSLWTVTRSDRSETYSYSNDLFVFDNYGIGHPIISQHTDLMILCGLVLSLVLTYLLKGGLFRWIEERRL